MTGVIVACHEQFCGAHAAGRSGVCASFDQDDVIQDDPVFRRVSLAFDVMFFFDIFLNLFTAYMPSKTTETDEKGALQVQFPLTSARPRARVGPPQKKPQYCARVRVLWRVCVRVLHAPPRPRRSLGCVPQPHAQFGLQTELKHILRHYFRLW
jgi:hypothetical protein